MLNFIHLHSPSQGPQAPIVTILVQSPWLGSKPVGNILYFGQAPSYEKWCQNIWELTWFVAAKCVPKITPPRKNWPVFEWLIRSRRCRVITSMFGWSEEVNCNHENTYCFRLSTPIPCLKAVWILGIIMWVLKLFKLVFYLSVRITITKSIEHCME